MQITIFTYNREQMLKQILSESEYWPLFKLLIIDDGSDYPEDNIHEELTRHENYVRFEHGGKEKFWERWEFAIKSALKSAENWFLFLPDDVKDVDMDAINELTKQGWDKRHVVVNMINDGRTDCWGYYRTGQNAFKIGERWYTEVGYCDCGFLTNRHTLEKLTLVKPREGWFDRPDKSSGVGYQLTHQLRSIQAKMMVPLPSLVYHGDHESVMHGDHRKDVPLKSK